MRWMQLRDLRPGAVFVTEDGVMAVKSEYYYSSKNMWDTHLQCLCILLASGEYAHFPQKNETMVHEIVVRNED